MSYDDGDYEESVLAEHVELAESGGAEDDDYGEDAEFPSIPEYPVDPDVYPAESLTEPGAVGRVSSAPGSVSDSAG